MYADQKTNEFASFNPTFRRLLAILLPGLSMIVNGHLLKGILCFILQITVIGGLPAAIWGVASRNQDLAEQRHRETLAVLPASRR